MNRIEKALNALNECEGILSQKIEKNTRKTVTSDKNSFIWKAHAKSEYALALLKLDLRIENPGEFNLPKIYEKKSDNSALFDLKDIITLIKKNQIENAFEKLKNFRDYLRYILIEERKHR
jgi:hypothetical protein